MPLTAHQYSRDDRVYFLLSHNRRKRSTASVRFCFWYKIKASCHACWASFTLPVFA